MEQCRICPRECNVDRRQGQVGYCGERETVRLARAALHYWEEPCISGEKGSGTVFFSGCNLRCVFCQNKSIAQGMVGREVSLERLTRIFLELQSQGANNINLVTPTHYVPQILVSLSEAKKQGLDIPVVYNSSAYEKRQTLHMLKGYVQIYLPDFKYWEDELARKYSAAPGYRKAAMEALDEMVSQAGAPTFDERGILQSGVIVRHLLLPGCVEDSKKIVRYLFKTYGHHIYISLMNQYTPMEGVPTELARRVTEKEYDELVDYALDLGVENGYIQEGETAEESFIPSFDYEGV